MPRKPLVNLFVLIDCTDPQPAPKTPIPVATKVFASATCPSPMTELGHELLGFTVPHAPVRMPTFDVVNVLVMTLALHAVWFVGDEPIANAVSKFGPIVTPFTTRFALGSGGVVPTLGPLPAMHTRPM